MDALKIGELRQRAELAIVSDSKAYVAIPAQEVVSMCRLLEHLLWLAENEEYERSEYGGDA